MSSKDSREYSDEEHLLPGQTSGKRATPRPLIEKTLLFFLCLSALVNIVLTFSLVLRPQATETQRSEQNPSILPESHIYSPANSVVKYKTVVFRSGLGGGMTEYQGPSDETNAKWEALYNNMAFLVITPSEASRLPNATMSLPQDPNGYVVQLDVFHQLHCLNLVRKLLYPAKYPADFLSSSPEAKDNLIHYEHCIEGLRQSLMCAADTSTLFFEWSPEANSVLGNTASTHTCRDFDKIRQWALDRKLQGAFDFSVRTPGAPIRMGD
ncbi:hypothetical protein OQA88_5826 [Cercophora sp. LCS_1]